MRSLFFLSVVISFSFYGCTTFYEVNTQDQYSLNNLNIFSGEYLTTIYMRNGNLIVPDSFYVFSDSTFYQITENHKSGFIKNEKITSINFRKRWKGAWQGLKIGALSGALSGAFMGLASGDDPPGWFSMKASEKALVGGLGFGVLGGLVGLPLGAAIGAEDFYYIVNEK
jgi:hypothetical protein